MSRQVMEVARNSLSDSKHLAAILAAIGDGFIATDRDGLIIYANEAAAAISDCRAESLVGKPFDEAVSLFNATTHERVVSPVARCLASGTAVGLDDQTVLVTDTGAIKYLSANCAPIMADGAATGAVAVFRDVTSYKILEQKSEDNDSNLKKIFETAPVGMLILDPQGKLVQVNHAALDIVGARKEQVLGKRFGDGFCCRGSFDDERGCGFGRICPNCDLRRSTLLALEGLTISDIECKQIFMGGGREDARWLRANFAPLAVDGKPHLVVSIVDITAQKKKEIAAVEARDFYLGIFENLPVIVWRSGKDGRNSYISSNWQRLTGQPTEAAVGDGWQAYVHPDDVGKFFAHDDGTPRAGASFETEIRVRDRSGKYRWLHCFNTVYRNIDGGQEGYIGMSVDITGRKEAEEVLSRYRLLSEKAMDIFLFIAIDGRIVEANAAALAAYGYTREELLTMTIFDLRGGETEAKPQLAEAFTQGVHFETTHYRKDGSSFPVEVKSQGQMIGGDKVVLSVIRDISERMKADEALRQSEEKFRVLFNKATDAMYITEEAEGLVVPPVFGDVNDVACDMLGYTREELLAMGPTDIDKAIDPTELAAVGHSLQTTGKMVFETTHTAKDGREIPVEVIGHNLELGGRRVCLMTARDITERKRAEEMLAVSRAEYQSLFLHMPSAFAYVRVIFDGQQKAEDLEYVAVNEAYENMVGLRGKELVGRRFRKVFPDMPQELVDNITQYGEVAQGRKEKVVLEFYSKVVDRWLSMTLYSPAREYVVALFTDITEQHLAHIATERAKNEAEAAYRAKSEFLANMSHEIRTPLNGINGMIDLTLMTDLTAEQQDNLLTAKSCAESLLGIISDILDFSKMEAGKLAVEAINFRCRDIVDEVVKVHSQAALIKGIDLDYSLSAKVPSVLAGDPIRLRQILNNLVGNAIKFTESGQVLLAVKRTGAGDGRVELTFSVSDTGIGIDEAEREKLFKPFSQIDGSITRRFGGTGLGLVISKQLVELMGGRLTVKSEKGKGSTFSFTVSLAPAVAGETTYTAKPVVEVRPASRALSLLLAEDDKVSKMVIQQYLRELNHVADFAADGQQALDLFARKRYDAVLMDIQMPVMDGVEATRRIREMEAGSGRYTPVIAITAHALDGDREKYLAAGLDEYIAKPVRIGELQAILELVTCPDYFGPHAEVSDRAAATAASLGERAKALEEISRLEKMTDASNTDLKLFEGLVHQIKVLANQAGLDEIKTLAFKAELAIRRGNLEEGVGYTGRIHEIVDVYRKTII
jgi:PAS domain S-box-containing protein